VGEGWARGGQGVGLLPPAIYTYFQFKKLYIEKKKDVFKIAVFFFENIVREAIKR
jgi:hypothetical protein